MTNLQKHLAFYNNDEELSFTDSTHRYYDKNDKTFLSATQLLSQFEPKFDEHYWGMYTALKDNGKAVKPDEKNQIIIVGGKPQKIKDLHKDNIYKHWFAATIAKWKGLSAEACFRGNNTHDYLETTIKQQTQM